MFSCGNGLLKQLVNRPAEGVLCEPRLASALAEFRRDFEEGRFYSTKEDMLEVVAEKRGAMSLD